jgi:uncharacterized delta-60 repeat protein
LVSSARALLAGVTALVALALAAHAQPLNLGSDLSNRSFNDGADGQLYLYDTAVGIAGKAQNFEFYDNESGSRYITPLIFEKFGDSYILRGIGTSRLTTGAGAQSYPFGLVTGSNDMGTNYTFGFVDRYYSGSVFQTYSGGGSVDWDYAAPTRWRITSGSTNFAVGVGLTYTVGSQLHATETRTYSARLTVNRAPTFISLSNTSIPENPYTAGYPVGTFSTNDPDGDAISYTLVAGSGATDNASFTISGSSLLLNGATDHEAKPWYYIRIRATDAGGNFVEQNFNIFIRNGNETPSFTKGANQTHAFNTTGTQTVTGWATAINDGDSTVNQALTFNVTQVSNTGIQFAAAPTITSAGTLSYSLVQSQGTATFNVSLTDDSTLEGAAQTSPVQTFTITVSAPAPEIDVVSAGDFTAIADGDTTPSAAEKTHFGQVATSLSRQFAIRNLGVGTLTISSITVTGENATEFVVTEAPTAITSGLLYFTVTYTPTAGVGVSRAKITINSNDADESAYDFLVEGEKAPTPYNSTWSPRTAAAASAWYSVTYGNGQFVAVANSGATQVMTSPDGSTWTARTIQAASGWYSVTYGNGQFVAVAQTGTHQVMNSPDGINWVARTTPQPNRWRSVTYGNGLFVAVSEDGTNRVMTSPDGVTWTARTAAQANIWLSVTYGNGRFVAVAYTGTNRVMTSTDGITWTAASTALNTTAWRAVTYGNGRFVAVGEDGTHRAATSTDGLTWTAHSSPPASGWVAVTYGNGLYVATAASGTNRVMTSPDGATWTAGNAIAANVWYSVTYGKDRFVSLSYDGTDRVMLSAHPDIAVTGNGVAIPDGATVPAFANFTHYGKSSNITIAPFTLTNTGGLPLTISSITSTGADASRFVVSSAPTSIAAGGSATFGVRFTPVPGVVSRATITINSNDPDEGTYDFAVEGSFTPPAVTSVLPSEGTTAGGTGLTIIGTGFSADATVTIGGVAATDVNVFSPTLLTCIAPAGSAGAKSVVVTNPLGENAANTRYTYVAITPGGLQALNANLSGIGGSRVSASVVQTDGKIILGGSFNSIHGSPRDSIARLNADGTLDSTFNLNLGSSTAVWALALQPDGKLLLGGVFNQAGGANRQNLARVNPDGTLDSFVGNTNGRVFALCLQPDGKILIGGTFTQVLSGTRNYIARLNSDGSLDTTFSPSLNGSVWTIGLDSTGRILVGGEFTAVQSTGSSSSTNYRHLVRLSSTGVLDTSFWPNPSHRVFSLLIQPDGKIAVGGEFSSLQPNGAASPTNRASLARLNSDGTLDPLLVSTGFSGVQSLALQADGKLIANAVNYGLHPVRRWDASGVLDASFNPAANQHAESVVLEPDGRVLLGGYFTTPRSYFARLNNDLATNTLSAPNLTQVVWLRGGSAPEISQVTFEQSTNGGASWSSLGTPVRVAGTANWQITGLNLPHGVQLRARGRTSGGYCNSSSYVIEQFARFSNSPPTDITLGASSLAENSPANAPVGTLATTDANTGDLFTYALVTGTGSTDNASFTISGASLRLTPVADFETKSSYAVRVRSTDAGGQFIEKALTVTITNVNEAPSFTKGADVVVPHSTTTAQTVNGWATAINDGDSTATQGLTFNVTVTSGANLFTTAPAISSTGVLTYQPNGTAGIATVQVTLRDDSTLGGPAITTAAQTFTITVQAPPLVPFLGSASPASGPAAGGTSVTITGTNFSTVTGVSFGGTPATSFAVTSDTSITAVTPAGTPGVANVTVTAAGGTSATNPLFTYFAPSTTTLTSSQNPSLSLAGPTFTARAVSAHPGLTGQMALFIDNVLFQTKAVDASGTATFAPSTSALRTGARVVRAVFNADGAATLYGSSSATVNQNVQRSSLPITLTGLAQTYNGTPKSVGANVTIPSGFTAAVTFTYNGSSTAPTAAGSYAVVATLDHPEFFGSATGTLVIGAAQVGIAFIDTLQAYDGTPRVAGVVSFPPGIPATLTYQPLVNNILTGSPSATAPTPAGKYRLTATSTNSNYVFPATTGELQVTKRGVTIRFGNTLFISDGQPKPVEVTTVPAGVGVTLTYTSGATTLTTAPSAPPAGGGLWTVNAVVTDQVSNIGSGRSTLDIVVKKPAVVTLTGPAAANPYEKAPYVAQIAPVRPGIRPTGTVIFKAGTIEIGRATPDAEGKCTLSNYTLAVSGTPYSVVAEYAGDDYQLPGTSAAVQTTMSKKIIDLGSRDVTKTYDGQPWLWSHRDKIFEGFAVNQPAITYNGGTTPRTNATSGFRIPLTVVAPLLNADIDVRETINLQINPQPVTISFQDLAQTKGTATNYLPTVVTVPQIPRTSYSLTFNGTALPGVSNPGFYTVRAFIVDSNYQPAEVSDTFALRLDPVSIDIRYLDAIYDGSPKHVIVAINPYVPYTVTYDGYPAAPRNPGSYTVRVKPNDPQNGPGTTATLTIDSRIWASSEEIKGGPSKNLGTFKLSDRTTQFPVTMTPWSFIRLEYVNGTSGNVRSVFTGWKDGVKDNPRLIEANQGVQTYVAQYVVERLIPATKEGAGYLPLSQWAKVGDVVRFEAKPDAGHMVARWEYAGETLGLDSVSLDGNYAWIKIRSNGGSPAVFYQPGQRVSVKIADRNSAWPSSGKPPDGTVSWVRNDRPGLPAAVTDVDGFTGSSTPAVGHVPYGATFTATAEARAGYTFNRWEVKGVVESAAPVLMRTNPLTFNPTPGQAQAEIIAHFDKTIGDVTVSVLTPVRLNLPGHPNAVTFGNRRAINGGTSQATNVRLKVQATGFRVMRTAGGQITYYYPNPRNQTETQANASSTLTAEEKALLVSMAPATVNDYGVGNVPGKDQIDFSSPLLDWPRAAAFPAFRAEVEITTTPSGSGFTGIPIRGWFPLSLP